FFRFVLLLCLLIPHLSSFYLVAYHRDRHSFPTRRSSDLAFSSAVLLANNLRDIPTDTEAGKRTLAVKLGDRGTRRLYLTLLASPFLITLIIGWWFPPVLFAVLAVLLAIGPARTVLSGATGRD